jgi:Methyltransferase domain
MTNPDDRPSWYYDTDAVAAAVAQSHHRDVIGGMWDAIGKLQFDFLCSQGLQPSSRMVDIGCGCLRGGHHFVAFLQAGNYHGTDISQALLDAGYEIELRQPNLQGKLPRANLLCDGTFAFARFPTRFDFALAQSLFTHLRAAHLRTCLAHLAPSMAPGGVFFATFFIVPDSHPAGAAFDHPHGVRTFDDRDPYHYRAVQIADCCNGLPWSVALLGDWRHPRDQQMVRFDPCLPNVAASSISAQRF